MRKITIVIVNWNTGRHLAKCLKALTELAEEERNLIDEVLVIDNASTDRSMVAGEVVVGQAGNKPRVRFVVMRKNVGFAAANNTAFKRIRAAGKPVDVLLLNPDTRLKPGAIKGLLGVLTRYRDAGVVGPRLLNPEGTLQKSVRAYPTVKDMILYMLKLGVLVKEYEMDYAKEQVVKQVMGAAFLIRHETWEQVGDLDEGYFLWFEEVDYCRRAEQAGWKIYYTPAAEIWHERGVSFAHLLGLTKTWPWLKSLIHYVHRHYGSVWAGVLILLAPVTLVLSLPATLKHIWQNNGQRG